MNTVDVKIIPSKQGVPTYATSGSAGFDIKSDFTADEIISKNLKLNAYALDMFEVYKEDEEDKNQILLYPNGRIAVPTNMYMSIPDGYQLEIRPRSGKSIKLGISIINTPGTIDSDYRGEIMILVVNLSNDDICIKSGEAIAQGIIMPTFKANFNVVNTLEETIRGEGGFGSSDKQ